MKKLTLLAIFMVTISSTVFACGAGSDLTRSEVSESSVGSEDQKPVVVPTIGE